MSDSPPPFFFFLTGSHHCCGWQLCNLPVQGSHGGLNGILISLPVFWKDIHEDACLMCSQLSLDKLLCPGVWHWFQCALLPVFHWIVRKKRFPVCRCGLKLYPCVFRVQVVSSCAANSVFDLYAASNARLHLVVLWYMVIHLHLWTMLQICPPPHPAADKYRTQMSLSQQQEVFVFIWGLLYVTAGHGDKTLSFLYLSLSSFD